MRYNPNAVLEFGDSLAAARPEVDGAAAAEETAEAVGAATDAAEVVGWEAEPPDGVAANRSDNNNITGVCDTADIRRWCPLNLQIVCLCCTHIYTVRGFGDTAM